MAVSPGQSTRPLRIAVVAPLVTTISEPQQGGSQVMVADLAVGLTRRGHDVDVYAATGSLIPGAHVIETGIDSARLSAALIRPGQPLHPLRAVGDAYEHVFEMVGRGGYDVVHSHGFDPPALRSSTRSTCRPSPRLPTRCAWRRAPVNPPSSSVYRSPRGWRGARSSRSTASSATACPSASSRGPTSRAMG